MSGGWEGSWPLNVFAFLGLREGMIVLWRMKRNPEESKGIENFCFGEER